MASSKVPEIVDDQPRNPYTEIKILSGHSDRIHLATIIDESRYLEKKNASLLNFVLFCVFKHLLVLLCITSNFQVLPLDVNTLSDSYA